MLSAFVSLPGPLEEGPYPTLVNYSGYDPSRPAEPVKGLEFLCKQYPVICDPPADGTGLIGSLLGYATVSVNIRGTGCSGGAYDYFETLEMLDGYDVIETVAAPGLGAIPQGGNDRHLLSRHRAAVRGQDAAAQPGRHLAHVGDRQRGHHALSGRHPQ